jgi:hypothetical protein
LRAALSFGREAEKPEADDFSIAFTIFRTMPGGTEDAFPSFDGGLE